MKHPRGKHFKPNTHPGAWITLGLAILALGLSLLLATRLPGWAVSGALFWLGILAVTGIALGLYLLYRAVALFFLRYVLDRNGLEIYWGGAVRRIPLQDIQDIVSAGEVVFSGWEQKIRPKLPYWWVWRWGELISYATAPLQNSLLVKTTAGNVIISPAELDEFTRAWQLRRPLGPTQPWSHEVVRQSVWGHPLWFDSLACRLGAGAILLCLILVGAVFTAFPAWPAAIPIHFNALGQARDIADKQQMLWIPAGGVIVLLFNLVVGFLWYKKERLATYLLWFVTILVQIGLWVGVRMVTG